MPDSSALLAWYQHAARDLPWRHTRDAYAIWVSEIMLQQTQVNTVLPRYPLWMQQFPDIKTLAAATPDAVMKAWEGLGYYRRARFLHQAAQCVMSQHGGVFPPFFDDMINLPGIGCSTAGAIASICFAMHTPVLDGNVKRVLRRWHGAVDAPDRILWQQAARLIEAQNEPAIWNQAMMELGACICTPRKPNCAACPVVHDCQSAYTSASSPPAQRVRVKNLYWRVDLHLRSDGALWMVQRPDSGIWGGLWSPPICELESIPDTRPCHIHNLTHRRLHLYGETVQKQPTGAGCWVTHRSKLALPTGIHRLLKKYGIAMEALNKRS